MTLIDPGQSAPHFELADASGRLVRLSELRGQRVVLYFYPKDDTSGCTAQACSFRDSLPDFSRLKATVLGVSPDDARSHERFATKHALNFTLLSDPPDASGNPKVCSAYGVWVRKSMYGRSYMGVARTTYIISPDGRVEHRLDKVKPEGHAQEVLRLLGGETAALDTARAPARSPSRSPSRAAARSGVTKKAAKAPAKRARPSVKKAVKKSGTARAGSSKRRAR